MVSCPNCGLRLDEDSKFCKECGAKVTAKVGSERAEGDTIEVPCPFCKEISRYAREPRESMNHRGQGAALENRMMPGGYETRGFGRGMQGRMMRPGAGRPGAGMPPGVRVFTCPKCGQAFKRPA